MCNGVDVDREPRTFQQQPPFPHSPPPPAGVCRMASVADHFSTRRRTAPAQGGGRRSLHPPLAGLCCHRPIGPPTNTSQAARTLGVWGRGRKASIDSEGQKARGAGLGQSPSAPSRLEYVRRVKLPSRTPAEAGLRRVAAGCSRGKTSIKGPLRKRGSNSQHPVTATCLLAAPAEPANPLSNPRAPRIAPLSAPPGS